ncbi:hypothetical protein H4R34_001912 [Dimargaris verticillata]|uniref:Uncharacterized protein n=1 Tax=Dimargaris verticillata TaxID=2761393 RepID=A0A9W8BAF4_9FUNG|nr:hypothetical protein H4R34_001912 [Dimargaris verticillata]
MRVPLRRSLAAVRHKPTEPTRRALWTQPSWSVQSLLPPATTPSTPQSELTLAKIQYLHRLANLELPTTATDAATTLSTLPSSSLSGSVDHTPLVHSINALCHFVSHIRDLDLSNVEPLEAIGTAQTLTAQDAVAPALEQAPHSTAGSKLPVDGPQPLLGHSHQTYGQYYLVPRVSDQSL